MLEVARDRLRCDRSPGPSSSCALKVGARGRLGTRRCVLGCYYLTALLCRCEPSRKVAGSVYAPASRRANICADGLRFDALPRSYLRPVRPQCALSSVLRDFASNLRPRFVRAIATSPDALRYEGVVSHLPGGSRLELVAPAFSLEFKVELEVEGEGEVELGSNGEGRFAKWI